MGDKQFLCGNMIVLYVTPLQQSTLKPFAVGFLVFRLQILAKLSWKLNRVKIDLRKSISSKFKIDKMFALEKILKFFSERVLASYVASLVKYDDVSFKDFSGIQLSVGLVIDKHRVNGVTRNKLLAQRGVYFS